MAIGLWLLPGVARSASIATFDDKSLAADSYWNGSDSSGGFFSGGMTFPNSFTDWGGGWVSWSGWAYCNKTDTTTAGFGNQYSAIAGIGAQGSSNYGVAYNDVGGDPATVTLPLATTVLGAYFTNTTYAYLSMRDGDSYAKKFVDGDWFLLEITGLDADGNPTAGSPVDCYLADYRSGKTYLANTWDWVDLTSLGDNVCSLQFDLSSSDVGSFGMNTPGYFAMDGLTIVPEPSTVAMLAGGLFAATAMAWRRRRCRRGRT